EAQAELPAVLWDWRDAIEAVVSMGRTVGLDVTVVSAEQAPWHPGRCAQLFAGAKPIGFAGELAPVVCKAFELPTRSIAFEVDSDAMFAARGDSPAQVAPVLTYPAAKEDLALVVDEAVTNADLEAVIRKAGGDLLEDLRLFDVYTGEQVPEGKKSLAYALRLRADHTLSAEETVGLRKKIVKQTKKKLGAELRS
ncbi:MAG: phenylalanine--tRNA ligase subunit beta, partial [Ancrocorticia populi]